MNKKFWGFHDLRALYAAFSAVTGREWDDAVREASKAGSVRDAGITGGQWDKISMIVSGRDRYQCARRLQTESRVASGRPTVVQPELIPSRDDSGELHRVYAILCPNATIPMEPGQASAGAEDASRRIAALIRDRESLRSEARWLRDDVAKRLASVSRERDELRAEAEQLRARLDEVTGR